MRKFGFVLELNPDNCSWKIETYHFRVKSHKENKNKIFLYQRKGKIEFPDYYLGLPITVIGSAFQQTPRFSLYTFLFRKRRPITCKQLILPSKLTKILYNGFDICPMIRNIEIPSSVDTIDSGIGGGFQWWKSLESIELPPGLRIINSIFRDCENLKKVEIKNNVKEIGREAFKRCYSLSQIEIPNSVERIEKEAFSNNISLKKMILPNSISFIGSHVFDSCINLEFIIIPSSVVEIDWYAFIGCENLTIYTDHRSLPGKWKRWNPNNCMVYWKDEWFFDEVTQQPVPFKIRSVSTSYEELNYPLPQTIVITNEMKKKYKNVSAKDLLEKHTK